MDALDVLNDPTRRRIVEVLAAGERSVSDVAARFDVSRPAISQHLAVLLDGGVLHVRTVGRSRLYRLNLAALNDANDWLSGQTDRWERVLNALETALDDGTA